MTVAMPVQVSVYGTDSWLAAQDILLVITVHTGHEVPFPETR
jgi:hypothetical protein